MSGTIADGKVVLFHYTLKNDDGDTLESSVGDEPGAYLHGSDNIVPGLERALTGHNAGDKVSVVVPPEDAYGDHEEEALVSAPLDAFPPDAELEPGMPLLLEDEEGEEHPYWIAAIRDEDVVLDANHPLAGETLHFDVEILEIRDATEEEKTHGHAHGPGDHEH